MAKLPVQLLEALVVFGDSKTISEAASILGITQPALSKQLGQLEDLVAHPLFSFSGRKKILTPFGRKLHQDLKLRIGDLGEVVHQAVNLVADARHAKIRIAGRRGVLDRISENARFPGFLEFIEASNDQVIQGLLTLHAEIGVAYSRPDSHEIISKRLFREAFQVAVPRALFAKKRSYGRHLLERLLQLPCLGFKAHDEVLNRLCEIHSIDPTRLRLARATSDYASIARMVETGFGWAVLPDYLELDTHRVWTAAIPASTFEFREFHLLYRREFSEVLWFKELIKEVMDSFKD